LCSFNIVGIKTAERKENPGKDEKIVPILSDLDISGGLKRNCVDQHLSLSAFKKFHIF
jgi:hypothetical protein